MSSTHSWDRFVDKVRVQVHQQRVFASWIEHTWEIKGFVVLSTCNTAARFETKDLLEAFQILWLDLVETQANWDDDKNAVPFVDLLLNFVQEYVTVMAHHHAETRNRLSHFVQLMKHVANCLGSIPVTRFAPVSQSDSCNAMNAERTHAI